LRCAHPPFFAIALQMAIKRRILEQHVNPSPVRSSGSWPTSRSAAHVDVLAVSLETTLDGWRGQRGPQAEPMTGMALRRLWAHSGRSGCYARAIGSRTQCWKASTRSSLKADVAWPLSDSRPYVPRIVPPPQRAGASHGGLQVGSYYLVNQVCLVQTVGPAAKA
jgi:hypothetical protein